MKITFADEEFLMTANASEMWELLRGLNFTDKEGVCYDGKVNENLRAQFKEALGED